MNSQIALKKQSIHQVRVEGFSHEGRGLATINGQKIFIEGALKGELANIELLNRRKKIWQAKVVDVLEASSNRQPPPCKYASLCGGCSLQHIQSQTQIEMKQATLVNHMAHFGQCHFDQLAPALQASTLGYRRKARLGVRFVAKKNKVLVGFREKNSSFLTNMDSCEVLDERVGHSLVGIQELITQLEAKRSIPQIEVAASEAQVALVFRHLEPLGSSDILAIVDFCQSKSFHCFLQPGNAQSIHRVWPELAENQAIGDERLYYYQPEFDLKLAFHPSDFTQVNAEINEQMVQQAVNWLELTDQDTVLDLFCGLGNFTLPVARVAADVVGIEVSDTMVKRGYENAAINQITNVRFIAADLMTATGVDNVPWEELPNKIVIDPPRSGAELICEKLKHVSIERLVYVSCNSATLARDTAILESGGLKCIRLGMLDMFPHTHHSEAMALFVRANA